MVTSIGVQKIKGKTAGTWTLQCHVVHASAGTYQITATENVKIFFSLLCSYFCNSPLPCFSRHPYLLEPDTLTQL